MKVYHASSMVVSSPDSIHSRPYLDFGPGFYVTTIERQVVDYGQRFIRRGRESWLNIYDLYCRSDRYLAEEIWRESRELDKN